MKTTFTISAYFSIFLAKQKADEHTDEKPKAVFRFLNQRLDKR